MIKLQQGDSGCEKDNYQCEPKTLSCIAYVCTEVLPIGTLSCNGPKTQLYDGIECNTVGDTGKCVEGITLGKSCADPFHVFQESTELCDDTNVCMKVLDLRNTGFTAENSKFYEANMCVNDT